MRFANVLYTLSSTAPTDVYSTVTSSLGTSFGTLVTNMGTMIAAVLPVGITIFGMYALIGAGKRVFSKLTGK